MEGCTKTFSVSAESFPCFPLGKEYREDSRFDISETLKPLFLSPCSVRMVRTCSLCGGIGSLDRNDVACRLEDSSRSACVYISQTLLNNHQRVVFLPEKRFALNSTPRYNWLNGAVSTPPAVYHLRWSSCCVHFETLRTHSLMESSTPSAGLHETAWSGSLLSSGRPDCARNANLPGYIQ